MVYLGDKAKGRDNNLNLIRMIAATAVLISHAYPIALGPGAVQPLQAVLGHTLGTLAVFAFFTISGFLITASFERSSSHTSFLAARFLRLYPALIVSLLVVGLGIAPLVSSLGAEGFLASSHPWEFIARNLTLASPMYELPTVFETNPYPAIEGSIWTLFYEVLCYMSVFLAGVAGLWRRRRLAAAVLGLYFVLWFSAEATGAALHPKLDALLTLSLPFAIGIAFYLWRDRLPLSLALLAALAGLAWLWRETSAYTPLLALALGYGVFWLGYVPGGWLRAYNRLGDYSYGMYIYAFPIQGLMVWLWGAQSPVQNMFLAFPATLAISVLSWHLIEAPALRAKARMVGWLRPA